VLDASSQPPQQPDAANHAAPAVPRGNLPRNGDANWYGEQDENGVHLSLIRGNLRLTVEEQIARGDAMRRSVLEMQTHARRVGHNSVSANPRLALGA
jgi:hypothetical protein